MGKRRKSIPRDQALAQAAPVQGQVDFGKRKSRKVPATTKAASTKLKREDLNKLDAPALKVICKEIGAKYKKMKFACVNNILAKKGRRRLLDRFNREAERCARS